MQSGYMALAFGGSSNSFSNQFMGRNQDKENFKIPGNFKILIVDDDDDFRWALSHRLKKKELNVVAVESGKKALTDLKDNDYDLILIDLVMPDMDGVETFRRIIEMKKDCFVIIMTAYQDDERIKIAKGMNPFGFLEKPFEFDQLLQYIIKIKERNNDE